MSRKYDLGFKKPPGSLKREPEVTRIHSPRTQLGCKTLVISEDGSIYARVTQTVERCYAPLDWSRRWTLVGHVGPDGINAFVAKMIKAGWRGTERPEALQTDQTEPQIQIGPLAQQIKKREEASTRRRRGPDKTKFAQINQTSFLDLLTKDKRKG